jgi:hypothetical protein
VNENPYRGPDDPAAYREWLYDQYGEITRRFPPDTVWESTHPYSMGKRFVVVGYWCYRGVPTLNVANGEGIGHIHPEELGFLVFVGRA